MHNGVCMHVEDHRVNIWQFFKIQFFWTKIIHVSPKLKTFQAKLLQLEKYWKYKSTNWRYCSTVVLCTSFHYVEMIDLCLITSKYAFQPMKLSMARIKVWDLKKFDEINHGSALNYCNCFHILLYCSCLPVAVSFWSMQ